MAIRLNIDHERLARVCHRWQVKELAVFGSALRADFGPDSDVDVLVSFHDAATPSLFDLATLSEELEALLGRPVDLLTRRAVEHSRNPYRRQEILSTAEILYAA
jgi:predicted nucleotidyltransferase